MFNSAAKGKGEKRPQSRGREEKFDEKSVHPRGDPKSSDKKVTGMDEICGSVDSLKISGKSGGKKHPQSKASIAFPLDVNKGKSIDEGPRPFHKSETGRPTGEDWKLCREEKTKDVEVCREYPSVDVSETKDVKWEMFGLKNALLKRIKEIGYDFPSPVQVRSIPPALKRRDILVRSKNGTGKTASYIIPMLNGIDPSELAIQAIVLVPIRELALQISRNVRRISDSLEITSAPIVGGTNLQEDIIRISNGVHVMIGTPGRVVDLIEKKVARLSDRVTLVFDEADKLLDITFGETVTKLLELLPKEKQMLLYSATFPQFITGFIKTHMSNPLCINLMNELSPIGVKQFYAYVKPMEKLFCLKSLLLMLDINQCIIFCNSIKTVELLAMKITEMGTSSYFIHSKMPQEERNAVFHNFLKGRCKILVATDLITRGVDVPSTNCVINFDFPKSTESYLHRIGRAGRFGSSGIAISLISTADKAMLMDVETKLDKEITPVSSNGLKPFIKNDIDKGF